jgi:hypothetical protein
MTVQHFGKVQNMTIRRRGFTLGNGPDANQVPELIDVLNRLPNVFGQQRLPNDTDDTNLVQRLNDLVSYAEQNKSSSSTMAMRNRMNGSSNRSGTNRPLTDAQVAARLRARGIDPKFMPKTVR